MRYSLLLKIPAQLLLAVLVLFAVPGLAQTTDASTALLQASQDSAGQAGGFMNDKIRLPYGPAQLRRHTTYSISSVRGESLKTINTPNLGNTLFGRLSGLYVSQRGSAPGNNDTPDLGFRGKQTFQDNSLLVLVDGFETTYTTLMPEEIESITVLKDAASLALYGLDGANGVMLITTKRGQEAGKNRIGFSSRFGVQSATVLPRFLGNGDYAEMYNQALASDGKDIASGYFSNQEIVDNFKSGANPLLYPDVDWYNELVRSNTKSQDYNLTINGGRPDARYFVALGYADYQGLYKGTSQDRAVNSNYNLQRYNLRANFDVDITRFLTSEISFRGTMLNKYFPNADENTLWRTMALFNPYPVKTDNGAISGKQGYAENPVASLLEKGYQSINDRTVDANVKIIGKLDVISRGLSAFGQINFNNFYYSTYNKTRNFFYEELLARPDISLPGEPLAFDRVVRGNTDRSFSISQGSGNQLTRSTFVGGLEYGREFTGHQVYASGMYLQEYVEGAGSVIPFARQNIMGRVMYNFQEKYFAELGYAFSGSENFPKGERFGFFPSISAGWMLHKEAFLSKATRVNLLKLRASAGLLGNDKAGNSGRFIFNQFYVGSGNYIIGNNLGLDARMFREGNLANPNVTWEKALKYNIGVDAMFFDRLSVAADYFYEYRSDILINPAVYTPAFMGASFYNVNKGKTRNAGLELELQYSDKIGPLGYTLGGNASYARNIIVSIEEPVRQESYLQAEGRAIGQPFVLEANGFFQDQNDISQSPKQLFGEVRPGDVKYKDQNKDGFIDDNDRIPTGNPAYPDIYYGTNAGLNFKGFDFNVFFQGAANRTVSLLDNGNVIPFLNGGVKPTQWVKDNYWTPERGNSAQFPRLTTEPNDNNYRASTLWQRDGSYIRLRSVELGYTLPVNLSSRMKMNSLRVYVSGNNLRTWDKIKEIEVDPEVMNMFVHPALKSYNLGFSLQL